MAVTVLLVEDDPDTARLIGAALQDAGIRVTHAPSGQAALERLAAAAVDCVLLDYRLPDVAGLEILREIRREHPDLPEGFELFQKIRQDHPDLPVVVLTAWGSEDVARQALKKLHASDYIPKHGRYLPDVVSAVREAVKHAIFRNEGAYWTIAYGGALRQLPDMKGYHHIAALLREPEVRFSATALVAATGPPVAAADHGDAGAGDLRITGDLGDAGPVLDSQARAAYRRRLGELAERLTDVSRELEEATELNDLGRRDKLLVEHDSISEEREYLERQLTAARGDRRVGAHEERARLIVTKNIKAAIERLRLSHPRLAYHLDTHIKTGYTCVYFADPEYPLAWMF